MPLNWPSPTSLPGRRTEYLQFMTCVYGRKKVPFKSPFYIRGTLGALLKTTLSTSTASYDSYCVQCKEIFFFRAKWPASSSGSTDVTKRFRSFKRSYRGYAVSSGPRKRNCIRIKSRYAGGRRRVAALIIDNAHFSRGK